MSRRIKSENLINILETNGTLMDMGNPARLAVRSHDDNGLKVIVQIGKDEYVVYGDELVEATKNAMVGTHYAAR